MQRSDIKLSVLISIYNKSNGHCVYCGTDCSESGFEIDHFYPKFLGGDNSENNLVIACKSCNRRKNKKDIDEFRDHLTLKFTDMQKLFLSENGITLPEIPAHKFYFEEVLGWKIKIVEKEV